MSKKILLKSSDGEFFEVDEAVALKSQTIAHMVEDDCVENGVPLANVSGKTLAKVIEYCKHHVVDGEATEEKIQELKKFDAEFVKDVERAVIFDILLAANYLNIKDLLDLICQTVADTIKDETPEGIRKIFNIENDFSPEEEKEVRKENAWAFD